MVAARRKPNQLAVHPADAGWFANITKTAAVQNLVRQAPPKPRSVAEAYKQGDLRYQQAGPPTPAHGLRSAILGRRGLGGAAAEIAQPVVGSARAIAHGKPPSRADAAASLSWLIPGNRAALDFRRAVELNRPAYRMDPYAGSHEQFLRTIDQMREQELMHLLRVFFEDAAWTGPPTELMARRDALIAQHGLLRQRAIRHNR